MTLCICNKCIIIIFKIYVLSLVRQFQLLWHGFRALLSFNNKKYHTDMRFRFGDFLQYVTVHPNFSESLAAYEVNGIRISVTVPSERLKHTLLTLRSE